MTTKYDHDLASACHGPAGAHDQVSADGYLATLSENGGMSYRRYPDGHRVRIPNNTTTALRIVAATAERSLGYLWRPVVDALLLGAQWSAVVDSVGLPAEWVSAELVAWGERALNDVAWDQLVDLIAERGGPSVNDLLDAHIGTDRVVLPVPNAHRPPTDRA